VVQDLPSCNTPFTYSHLAMASHYGFPPQYAFGGMCQPTPALYHGALAQENLRLLQENMYLQALQDNRRLAHENAMLRVQAASAAIAPPGLDAPLKLPLSDSIGSKTQPKDQKLVRERVPTGSTEAGSTDDASRSASDDGEGSCRCDEKVSVGRTTVMMKNLPNNYTSKMLMELLEDEGFGGSYDLLYLPIDFHSSSGLGYAFLNLIDPEIAERLCTHFTGFSNWRVGSDKVCLVTWSDTLQGLQAHIERYRNSPVMHESVPEDHKPMLFQGSQQVPFPPPTKKIRAPRRWHRRH